jgi:hypothetical protein
MYLCFLLQLSKKQDAQTERRTPKRPFIDVSMASENFLVS